MMLMISYVLKIYQLKRLSRDAWTKTSTYIYINLSTLSKVSLLFSAALFYREHQIHYQSKSWENATFQCQVEGFYILHEPSLAGRNHAGGYIYDFSRFVHHSRRRKKWRDIRSYSDICHIRRRVVLNSLYYNSCDSLSTLWVKQIRTGHSRDLFTWIPPLGDIPVEYIYISNPTWNQPGLDQTLIVAVFKQCWIVDKLKNNYLLEYQSTSRCINIRLWVSGYGIIK